MKYVSDYKGSSTLHRLFHSPSMLANQPLLSTVGSKFKTFCCITGCCCETTPFVCIVLRRLLQIAID